MQTIRHFVGAATCAAFIYHLPAAACQVAAGGLAPLIGSIGGGQDAALFTGYHVTFLTNGNLAVHDPIKGQLLVFGRFRNHLDCARPLTTIELRGAPISAIIQQDGEIFGVDLSGDIRKIFPHTQTKPTGEATGSVDTNPESPADNVIELSRFAASFPLLDGKAIWPGVANAGGGTSVRTGEIGLAPSKNRLVSVPNGTILIENIKHRHEFRWQDSSSGRLKIWRVDSANTPLELPITVPGILGAVDIIRATKSGFTISVESFGLDKNGIVQVEDHLFNFGPKGELKNRRVVPVPVPTTSGHWTPMESPALSDPTNENKIHYFYRDEDSLSNIEIDLRQAREFVATGMHSNHNFVAPDARRVILIKRAEEFVNASWRADSTNLNLSNASWRCSPPYSLNAERWAQPIFLRNVLPGARIFGVPYLWGGKSGWKDFLSKMANGGIAGNVCTRQVKGAPVSIPSAAGIDCSGFVSRVWELGDGKHRVDLSTSSLATDKYSRKLRLITDLQPGDIFNKPATHVRLFAGWIRTPFGLRVRSFESTTDSICSGTCMRDLRIRAYIGYTPRGFPN